MTRATDLLREAHTLAEDIRNRRAGQVKNRARGDKDLTALQLRLTNLWTEIRAARAGGPEVTDRLQRPERRQAKWD